MEAITIQQFYGLFIGINDYPNAPLRQCLNDVEKIKQYWKSLALKIDGEISTTTLLNEQATKENISTQVKNILKSLKKEDTFFFYFSGHGAQEDTNNRFPEEQDKLLECLVCYSEENQNSGYLLADKELRYLLSTCNTQAHIVSIFDCCHAGDMIRSDNTIKRMSNIFPARPYEEFLFAPTLPKQQLKAEGFNKNIPSINSIHIAACQSNQSAWEDKKGGVFTRYLLRVLKESHSLMSYQFITQWIKVNIRDITSEKQVPIISVQGEGRLSATSNWLGLYVTQGIDRSLVFYKEEKGWFLNRGVLFGVQKGSNLVLPHSNNTKINGVITEVDLEDAQVEFSEAQFLEVSKVYPIDTTHFYRPLQLHLLDLQENNYCKNKVNKILSEENNFLLSSKSVCDFQIVLFDKFVYVTLPNLPFQPLTDPISTDLKQSELALSLLEDLRLLRKWNHFYHLKNPQQNAQTPLIQVALTEIDTQKTVDITNGSHTLYAYPSKTPNGEWYSKYQIKVSNKSNKDLYIVVLTLGSNLSISSKPYDNQCVLLPSGTSKSFYDHLPKPIAYCSLDKYKEVFNWEQEWFHYQFLVNDGENISTSIPFFLQGGAAPDVRGIDLKNIKQSSKNNWAVYTSKLHLQNPSYNSAYSTGLSRWLTLF